VSTTTESKEKTEPDAPFQPDLRDWFAGQALSGIMGFNYDWFTSGTETGSRTHEAAYFAYSLADAMLAARATGEKESGQ